MTDDSLEPPWVAVHARACEAGHPTYRDPETGYSVFSEVGLRRRGRCCGCACRHCPWGHEAVPVAERARRAQRPTMLVGSRPRDVECSIVFWSGGKDSFLALRRMRRLRPESELVLLTTFDRASGVVAHQELRINRVVLQAQALGVSLLGVPLVRNGAYETDVAAGLAYLAEEAELRALVFGDLHLEEIRRWREARLGPMADAHGAELMFPLWRTPYEELFDELVKTGAEVVLSAAPEPGQLGFASIGDRFDRALVARFAPTVDPFGESGEFHTEVRAESLSSSSLR
ncbi:MAG: DUF5522 domain-containing protein [Myxococcota bacterium]